MQDPNMVQTAAPSKEQKPQPITISLPNVEGLEKVKPGEEVTITCQAKLMEAAADEGEGTMAPQFEVISATATPATPNVPDATKNVVAPKTPELRKKRATELIKAGAPNENGPGDEGIEAQMYPSDEDEKE